MFGPKLVTCSLFEKEVDMLHILLSLKFVLELFDLVDQTDKGAAIANQE